MRRILKKLHLWLGASAGLVLTVVAVTGLFLAYEPQLRLVLGERVSDEMVERRLGPGEVEARVAEALPAGQAAWYLWRADARVPLWLRWRGEDGVELDYMVDPYDGRILPRATAVHAFFTGVLSLHRTLLAGEAGRFIVGTSVLLASPLFLSGVLISARRLKGMLRAGTFRRTEWRQVRWPRWRAVHRTVGAWGLPVVFLSAITGLVWSFEWYGHVLHWVTRSKPAEVRVAPVQEPIPARLSTEEIWAIALPQMTGSAARRMILPADPATPVRVEWAPAEVPYESFRSRLWIDPGSGAILGSYPLSDYSTAEVLKRWAYPVHTGRIGGWPMQTLMFLGTATLPFLFVTGIYLYVLRQGCT